MSKGAGRCVATLVGQFAPPSRTACLRARTPVHQAPATLVRRYFRLTAPAGS